MGVLSPPHGHPVCSERPPSDDTQHLPSILLAEVGVNPDDSAMPRMASDNIAASGFMADLPDLPIISKLQFRCRTRL